MHKYIYMGTILKYSIVIIAAIAIGSWSPKAYAPYAYGQWTPTMADGTNSSGASASAGNYTRTGNVVTFSFTLTTTTSAGASATDVTASLPIASNFSATTQTSGTNSGLRGGVACNTTSDLITISWTSGAGGSETIIVTGQYRIL